MCYYMNTMSNKIHLPNSNLKLIRQVLFSSHTPLEHCSIHTVLEHCSSWKWLEQCCSNGFSVFKQSMARTPFQQMQLRTVLPSSAEQNSPPPNHPPTQDSSFQAKSKSRLVHDLLKTCSGLVHNLFTYCSLLVHSLFTPFSRLVQNLFIACSQLFS